MNRSQLDINNKKVSIIKIAQFTFLQVKCSLITSLHIVHDGLSVVSSMEAREIKIPILT